MGLLVFAIIVVVLVWLGCMAAAKFITDGDFSRIAQGLVIVVGLLLIANRAGLV